MAKIILALIALASLSACAWTPEQRADFSQRMFLLGQQIQAIAPPPPVYVQPLQTTCTVQVTGPTTAVERCH